MIFLYYAPSPCHKQAQLLIKTRNCYNMEKQNDVLLWSCFFRKNKKARKFLQNSNRNRNKKTTAFSPENFFNLFFILNKSPQVSLSETVKLQNTTFLHWSADILIFFYKIRIASRLVGCRSSWVCGRETL